MIDWKLLEEAKKLEKELEDLGIELRSGYRLSHPFEDVKLKDKEEYRIKKEEYRIKHPFEY